MTISCTCEKFVGFTFRPALSSLADNPVLIRVCPACDLPILGHGKVMTSRLAGWQVFHRKGAEFYRTHIKQRKMRS